MVRGNLHGARRKGRDLPEPSQAALPQPLCEVQLCPWTALLLPGVTPTPPAQSRALEKGIVPETLLHVSGFALCQGSCIEQHRQPCACGD